MTKIIYETINNPVEPHRLCDQNIDNRMIHIEQTNQVVSDML
jgi:hypothetical protein